MRRLFLSISALFFYQLLLAQVTFPSELQNENDSTVLFENLNVNEDPRLQKLVNWQIENNRNREGIDGYRVEIFFSSNMDAKQKALEKKVEFLSKYPDYNVHVLFVAPNFRVRVGDFRTKNEALKLFKEIEKDYRSAFVVKDIINFPMVKPNSYE